MNDELAESLKYLDYKINYNTDNSIHEIVITFNVNFKNAGYHDVDVPNIIKVT